MGEAFGGPWPICTEEVAEGWGPGQEAEATAWIRGVTRRGTYQAQGCEKSKWPKHNARGGTRWIPVM